MWLSRGLVASTLLLAVKAQDVIDGIDAAALRIASGFDETLIQHAYTTLSPDAAGAGDAGGVGDAANGGNPDQAFDATLLNNPQGAADNGASVTQIIQNQVTIETYTRPNGVMFPVTLLPHPRITIAPHSGDPYERIIQAYTGGADATTNQEITIAEPSGTKPGTVIVDVPGTAYSSFSSGQPGALTIPPSNDNPTATIISALPSGAAITGDATRTIPAVGNAPATVVIQTPWADVPPNTAAAGGSPGGNVGGADGNAGGITTIPGSGGNPGTVVLQVPTGNQIPDGAVTIPPNGDSHFSTIIRQYTGPTPISTPVTILIPTSAGQDGTIIIETPGPSSGSSNGGSQDGGDLPENRPQVIPPSGNNPYTTILRPHAGSDQITEPVTYTIQPSGTNPGTVIIETPAVRPGQQVITLPSDPDSGYITVVKQPTRYITAPVTSTIPPSGGQPGTIIIETPAPQAGNSDITIPAGADGSLITIIRGPTGASAVTTPTTTTITGAAGQPGTVIIETPVSSGGGQITRGPSDPFTLTPAPGGQYVTVFRPHSGDPISVPITLTQGGQNGQPGTIIIETPAPNTSGGGAVTIPAGSDNPYVTVYRPHTGSPIDKPITITVPPNGNQPGTIIVETPVPTLETPKGQNALTSPGGDGQGVTVTVQPSTPGGYTTVYRPHTGDPISEPVTVTTISGSNGQPGTVIIETQGPITITATNAGGTATIFTPGAGDSTTVTKTIVETAPGGQPTTVVVIETPPPVKVQPTSQSPDVVTGSDGYVTVVESYTGTSVITAIFTRTVFASGTNPGTVFIETPPPNKFASSQAFETTVSGNDNYVTVYKPFPGPGIITAPITITEVAPSGGQPGTVVVQTPVVAPPPTTDLPSPSTTQGSDGYVTVFLPFPGPGVITQPYTRTQAPSGGNPGTVFITTPAPVATTTTPLPEPSTTQGPDGYVTVFLPFPGPGVITQPYTRTQPPSGGNPGTVFITTPAPVPATTAQPSTTSGTDGYVTVFVPYPGPGEITSPITSTQPPSGGQPGTVFITTPGQPAFTTPKQANGLTSSPAGNDGYVTVFLPYTGQGEITAPITSTQAPANGQPGTVFITTPGQPAFTTPKQANGLTSTSNGPDGYVTVYLPYTGTGEITAPITSTQAPANGQPGTVYITTPGQPAFTTPNQANGLTSTSTGTDGYVTVYLPYTGTGEITAPITSTQAPANGQPGTVYITTPGQPAFTTPKQANGLTSTSTGTDGYVTVYLPYTGTGEITAPVTSTQPPSGGNPGTVYITTPGLESTTQQNAPSTTPAGEQYITVFLPFPGPGVITAPVTRTQAPSDGNPGTVFITTPAPETSTQPQTSALTTDNYITIYTPFPGPGVITAPVTITKPPSSGQPGTVLIQTPAPVSSSADSYVTVYRPYPGPGSITAPITLTQAPANGQPGTIFIETQAIETSTSTTPTTGGSTPPITIPPEPTGSYVTVYRPYPGPGQISSAITYTQAPISGSAGTIIIETPNPDANTATQSGPATIPTGSNNPYVTVYKPYPGPGNIDQPVTITAATPSGDQPGTIIIETPTLEVNTKFAPTPTTSPPVTIPADNNNYVTVYRPHTGSPITVPLTVTTIAPSAGQPGTVIIETPGPDAQTDTQTGLLPAGTSSSLPTTSQGQDAYLTVYRPYPGPGVITAPVTVTTIAPSAGQPGTVIIETPGPDAQTDAQTGLLPAGTSSSLPTTSQGQDGYLTVYRPYPGPGVITVAVTVTTILPTNGQPGTVIIETPGSVVETSPASELANTTPSAVTIPAGDGGYVTVYRPYPGPGTITAPRTVGTVSPSDGRPGTIIIETPAPQTTVAETTSAQADVTRQGTDGYVTVLEPYTGTGDINEPTVVSTIAPSNGLPGTKFVGTPTSKIPTTSQAGGDTHVTIPPGPGNPYVTVYRPHTGADVITAPVTVTTIEGIDGQPGTIVVETPVVQATNTEKTDQAPVTIPPGPDNSYVTVYRPHTGADVITAPVTVTTIEGINGQPGTIVIETPVVQATNTEKTDQAPVTIPPGPDNSYVTVYRPHTGADVITAPVTVTTIEGVNGQPGTIVIETPVIQASNTDKADQKTVTVPPGPDNSYTTVYRPYTGTGTIVAPLTVSTIPGVNGQPGTVIVETPTAQDNNAPSTAPVGSDGAYTTVYRPYAGIGTITAPITVSTIPGVNGQPGTVIVETPTAQDNNAPSTAPIGSDGAYTTVYRPYTGIGTITVPITVSTIPGVNGQPGTVIVETPAGAIDNTGVSSTAPVGSDGAYTTAYRPYTGIGTITAPITVSTIPGVNGQPGTVIVETPAGAIDNTGVSSTALDGSDGTYTTVYRPYTGTGVIEVPVTVSTIPGVNGQPGTIIVETPIGAQDTSVPTTAPAQAGSDGVYSTVYRPYTGTGTITAPQTVSTIPGINGQPGAIIVETPVGARDTSVPTTGHAGTGSTYTTVYRPYPGPGNINEPITVTTVEPSNGNPGTVIIETPGLETGGKVVIPPVTLDPAPGDQYVTVYRPHTGTDIITAPVTIRTIAPSGGQPGTVIIETPEPETPGPNPTVTLPPGPNQSYVTVFRPHAGADVITGPITITTIAPVNGQPGTVIIETPAQSDPASTPAAADSATGAAPQTAASYVTVYRPHTGTDRITAPITITTVEAVGDQPGTVIIETPDRDLPPVTTSAGPAATYVTVYQPHTGADRITEPVTITTIEPANGQPGTVVIETPGQQAPPVTSTPAPASYVTISRPYTGTEQLAEPVTTTIPPQGDQPGTVIVETPIQKQGLATSSIAALSYTTITRPYTGTDQITAPVVITVPPQGDQPGTVIEETQAPFVTVYRPHTGPDQITGPVTVSTIAPTGGEPGTIIVETPGAAPAITTTPPAPSYVTITSAYTGTDMLPEHSTITTIPAQGDVPGTVIVQTQAPYATISTLYTGTGVLTAPTALTTIPPYGDQPGTVILGTAGSYVTITTLYAGKETLTGPIALTTIPPRDGQPGTVIIATPASYVITTVPYTGTAQITAPITTTIQSPSGDQPGTVAVQTQAPFVTVYRPHIGADRITTPITVTTIAPAGDKPGTVVIETPGSEPPVTTTPPAPSYNTVYEQYTGSEDVTEAKAKTTIEPQGDQPGTVIFETPAQRVVSTNAAEASYVTVYQPHNGPDRITAPVTVTTISPQGGQPGTVIIETPGSEPAITSTPSLQPSYVTVYQPHTGAGSITEPVTRTVPPQGDQPGTVFVETPGSGPAITSGPVPAASYVTVYQPHTGAGSITEPVTRTVPPQGDQPGTVFIETPGSGPAITSGPAPVASYITVYQPHTGAGSITEPVTRVVPPQGDQPGTVFIETPGSGPAITSGPVPAVSYVTVYQPHTGTGMITEPVTITTIAPNGDQPGTVIIETPGSEPPVTSAPAPVSSYVTVYRPHTGADQIISPITVTTIAPAGDQPGTVIIETPGSEPPVTSAPAPMSSYVTVYRPHTGADQIISPITVTTIAPAGDQPGTVIIETPGSLPAVTSTPVQDSSPESSYVTVYRPHTGVDQITAPITITQVEPQGGQPGTIVIETPGFAPAVTSTPVQESPYVTVYRPHTGTDPITIPVTIGKVAPQGDQPGTVIIETPGSGPPVTSSPAAASTPIYATVYRPHTGTDQITAPVTITEAEPSGDRPGTVIVETPGSGTPATIVPPPPPDVRYVTSYRPHTGPDRITAPVIVTTMEPQGDQPGTVIIETPGSEPAVTSTPAAETKPYATVYRPYTGIGQITTPVTVTTIAPQGDQPGTVIIETPGSEPAITSTPAAATKPYATVYRPYTGVGQITTPVTVTTVEPQGDQPGTVIIETPGSEPAVTSTPAAETKPYATVYRPYTGIGQITTPVTVTTIAPQGDQPGTVIIETPGSEPAVTSSPAAVVPISEAVTKSYATVYRPHTGTDQITAPVTVTTIEPQGDQPGTVIIETPGSELPVTSMPVASYTTIYEPYMGTGEITGEITRTVATPQGDQPGTIIVETPGIKTANKGANPPLTISPGSDGYVTVFRPHTGVAQITGPVTLTTISPSGGRPGTVIIETPVAATETNSDARSPPVTLPPGDDQYVTIFRPHTGSGTITAPVTITTISPEGGRPGTVIVETPEPATIAASTTAAPEDIYITISRPYTGTEQITAPVTTTIPPVSGTGTVIVETLTAQTASVVYVTVHRPYTGTGHITEPTTVTTIAPVSGTGTVIIETPTPEPTTEPPTSPAITIPSNDAGRNVTVIKPYPGPGTITAPLTKYSPATAVGEPGTVVIETPVNEQTTEAQPQSQGTSAAAVTIPPSSNSPNTTVVRQYPGPGVITAPITSYEPPSESGKPGTVIIETPAPISESPTGPVGTNVTLYTLAPPGVKTPITSYAPPQTSGQAGTVFIQTVASDSGTTNSEGRNTTITREGSADLTAAFTTYSPPGTPGDPGTVIVETPPVRSGLTTASDAVTISAHPGSPNVTVIRGGPGKEASTIYVPPTGTEPGTIIIETPTTAAGNLGASSTPEGQMTSQQPAVTIPPSSNSPNVTVIQPYSGTGSITEPITRYVPPTAPGEPGTILVETMRAETSVPTSANAEITLPPSSQNPNVTVIRPYPGPGSITEPVTRYVAPTAAGEPGTIIIETQTTDVSSLATSDSKDQALTKSAGITIPANSASPNVTVIRQYTGSGTIDTPITSYIPPGTAGEPGTVVIETPATETSKSSMESQAQSSTGPASVSAVRTAGDSTSHLTTPASPLSSNAGGLTLTPSDTNDDITILQPNTKFADATENVTQIIPPSNGTPGTKIIFTPVDTGKSSVGAAGTDTYVTISATVTIPGDPATRTGSKSNAGGDAGTTGAETNVIIIPPSGTEPGTVLSQTSVYLDQTLAQHGNVTITKPAPSGATSPFTTYSPPAHSTDPGTVIIEVPNYNVTITRAASDDVTTKFTTYSPPASAGDPGTIIIEIPDYNVTVTRQAPPSITSLRTTYNPPGTAGDPGTVIVETPSNDFNVTITRAAPASITSVHTTYAPPGSAGDP
ncbi:hypothetical protein FHETE_7555, partial [Fusarium heterosporum]